MEKLTFSELMTEIEATFGSVSEFAHNGFHYITVPKDFMPELDSDYESRKQRREEYLKTTKFGTVNVADQQGGEGEGEEWYIVYHFVDHDVYIRVDGWYQSYYGTEFDGWDSCSEVRPQQRMVTFYE